MGLITDPFYQPRMIDDYCGAVGGMRIGRGNRSTRRKPTPAPLCAPQIPHDVTCARIRAAGTGSQRLTEADTSQIEVWSLTAAPTCPKDASGPLAVALLLQLTKSVKKEHQDGR
jgi:hypothetical protein